jgi:diguanylate cyclase (GGDEF)-like protein
MGLWFDIYAMPLDQEDTNIFYCSYTATPSHSADDILDTINTSQTSNDVLKTCIKLHEANNLKAAMESVISDIRNICKAEGCTVLLINYDEEEYSILATDYVQNSKIKRVTQFNKFYDIAASWEKMIGEEGDCIIAKDEDDMNYISKINHAWYLTLVEAGVKSVVLFPLRQGNELLGFIWAINFDTQNALRIKETLELTTFFISSHIARYKVLKRLKHMGYTDTLTGLPNRFACNEYISELITKDEKFAVVSIDLNNFKSINDTLGFDGGNKVLIEVSKRWKAICEEEFEDIEFCLTRTGADEFILVISGNKTNLKIEDIISRYVEALNDNLTIDGYDIYVTASFGYAEYPSDANTTDTLISRANSAMKEVKKVRNSEHILRFTPDILKDEHIIEIENLIRSAIENDTIYFNLQPQFDMDHKLRGFEALARMKDVNGNIISPGEFIPVAEKVGLIDMVDGTVFKKAADFFGRLMKKNDTDLTLSINASVRHLMKNDFIEEIQDLLKTSGIPADRLEIEITESIMIDSEKALQRIEEIKKTGVQIAIDDFGTGYSSLSYLNRFPANLLKVDKSFIDKMNTSESSRQYVAEIISIGHIMGFDVISEGVEEPEQLETLKSIGCDYIQGFIWGRPLSAEDAEKLVTGQARGE